MPSSSVSLAQPAPRKPSWQDQSIISLRIPSSRPKTFLSLLFSTRKRMERDTSSGFLRLTSLLLFSRMTLLRIRPRLPPLKFPSSHSRTSQLPESSLLCPHPALTSSPLLLLPRTSLQILRLVLSPPLELLILWSSALVSFCACSYRASEPNESGAQNADGIQLVQANDYPSYAPAPYP